MKQMAADDWRKISNTLKTRSAGLAGVNECYRLVATVVLKID